MEPFDPNLPAMIAELRSSWQRQSIACPPLELSYVQAVIAANRVVLPPDFIQLYCTVNGTPELYPNYMNENFCSFLPIEALEIEQKEMIAITNKAATLELVQLTVFVDFMHHCWDYEFISNTNDDGYWIGIIALPNEFKVISASLANFLQLYLKDDDVLYDYDNPFSKTPGGYS